MKGFKVAFAVVTMFSIGFLFLQVNCGQEKRDEMSHDEMVERGGYLVNLGGCNDCHSPKIFTPTGFEFDSTKLLSGHPAQATLPLIDTTEVTPGKWYLVSSDLTAWVGPWGISYTANLTPHEATGLGNWTDEIFIQAMRTGKHMGAGRPILPPMPWQLYGKLTDEDLKAILAYLKSLPAIENKVPDPTPPTMVDSLNKKLAKM